MQGLIAGSLTWRNIVLLAGIALLLLFWIDAADAAHAADFPINTVSAATSRQEAEGWFARICQQAQQFAQRPISGAAHHYVDRRISWHGRAMVFAWGILLPVGVLVARFFKIMPGQDWPGVLDNKTWWYWHRVLQYGGVLVMTAGVACAISASVGKAPWRNLHTLIGWGIVSLAWMQIVSGHLRGSKGGPAPQRGGDHYDMTSRRILFERLHKTLGYAMLLLSSATIFLGLALADAPLWMWGGQFGWSVVLCMAFIRWQRCGRCIDTYQAIWGPDTAHPGNRIPPIGWGIRRYTARSYVERFKKNATSLK